MSATASLTSCHISVSEPKQNYMIQIYTKYRLFAAQNRTFHTPITYLLLDGVELDDGEVDVTTINPYPEGSGEETTYTVDLAESHYITDFVEHDWGGVPESILSFTAANYINDFRFIPMFDHLVKLETNPGSEVGHVSVSIPVDAAMWTGEISIFEYMLAYEGEVERSVEYDFEHEEEGFSFIVGRDVLKSEMSIAEAISCLAQACHEFHKVAASNLDTTDKTSISAEFDFPEAVKVPCEQYLQYFVQFLKDAGVGATADLTHEAGKVLFTVTPNDKEVALDRIRQALIAYLALPTNPSVATTPFYGQPPQVQQLLANIQHLNGQLMIASAAMQFKDATIQNQQGEIDYLRQKTFTADVMLQSLILDKKDKDKVGFLWNTVELSDLELMGVKVKLSEIYRRLQLPNFFKWLGNHLVEIRTTDTPQIEECEAPKLLEPKADHDN